MGKFKMRTPNPKGIKSPLENGNDNEKELATYAFEKPKVNKAINAAPFGIGQTEQIFNLAKKGILSADKYLNKVRSNSKEGGKPTSVNNLTSPTGYGGNSSNQGTSEAKLREEFEKWDGKMNSPTIR